VLLSSHVLGDVAETVDRVVVIARGKRVADAPVSELVDRDARVRVASPQAEKLAALVRERGARVAGAGRGEAMTVTGLDRDGIGELAAAHGVVLHELVDERPRSRTRPPS
jgi:ABC-2 type transport system ATP-binding protein